MKRSFIHLPGPEFVPDNIEVKISRAKSSKNRKVLVLRLTGQLRYEGGNAAGRFLENLERSFVASDEYEIFLMDWTEVKFLDSTGLGNLVWFYKKCSGRGIELVLCGLQQPGVKKTFVTTKLLSLFRCFENKKEALDTL